MNRFEKHLDKYNKKIFEIDELQKCIVIEDSLVLYIGIIKSDFPLCLNVEDFYSWTWDNDFMDYPEQNMTFYELYIEELTYDTLGFKYNHTNFIRELEEETRIKYLGLDIVYKKFKGFTRLYWSSDTETLVEKINREAPELRLRERYESWEGVRYNFIVMKMKDGNEYDKNEYAVAYTTMKSHAYILLKGKNWIRKGMHGDFRQIEQKFTYAFNTWKGTKRQYRLENYFKYYSLQENFREKDDVWRYADEILERAYNGGFNKVQYARYNHPENKWKSEELVYKIVKRHFHNYNVIYQHRPFFLKSDIGGQMSYDVFISGLNVAIEYQGKQHFEPVEFFGGEESYCKTVERDKLKRELSKKNDIVLIYVNYWENISPEIIVGKINELIEKIVIED